MMAKAGVNVNVYRPHSLRAASTSKAFQAGTNIDDILHNAGWSNATTFARFYNKPIQKQNKLAENVLAI